MKTFITILLTSFTCITTYAQYDSNGMPITDDNVPSNSITTYYEDTPTGFQDCIWEDVRPLDEINTNNADAYPWISPDGLRLYFTQGSFKMASRTNIDSLFGNIEVLPLQVDGFPISSWLTNDELEIFYSVNSVTSTLYHAIRDSIGAAFSSPTIVQLSGLDLDFLSGPSLTQDKSQLFLYSSDNEDDIHVFEQINTNNYIFSHTLDFANPQPGQLTKNSLGYYVTSESFDLYSSYRNSVDSTFNSFIPLEGIVNSSNLETQPTLSENEEFMVFVTSLNDSWGSNDLYIARGKCTPTHVEQAHQYQITIRPIPASSNLNINIENEVIKQVNLYDVLGKYVLSQTQKNNQINIDVQNLPPGVYFCQINLKSGHSTTRKIVIE